MAKLGCKLPRCGKKTHYGGNCPGCREFICEQCMLLLIEACRDSRGQSLFSVVCPHCRTRMSVSNQVIYHCLEDHAPNKEWSFPIYNTQGCEQLLVCIMDENNIGTCRILLSDAYKFLKEEDQATGTK